MSIFFETGGLEFLFIKFYDTFFVDIYLVELGATFILIFSLFGSTFCELLALNTGTTGDYYYYAPKSTNLGFSFCDLTWAFDKNCLDPRFKKGFFYFDFYEDMILFKNYSII